MTVIDVQGPVRNFFYDGLVITREVAELLVGKPIKDSNGNTIGKIDRVDCGAGLWYGRIVVDTSLSNLLYENHLKSLEIVKEDNTHEN